MSDDLNKQKNQLIPEAGVRLISLLLFKEVLQMEKIIGLETGKFHFL